MLEDAPEPPSRADLSHPARVVADGVRRGRSEGDHAIQTVPHRYGAIARRRTAVESGVGQGRGVLRGSPPAARPPALRSGVCDGARRGGAGRADLLPQGNVGGGGEKCV